MSQEWIVDVLADLKTFARQNDMGQLAEHLDETMMVAAAELAHRVEGEAQLMDYDAPRTGTLRRVFADSEFPG